MTRLFLDLERLLPKEILNKYSQEDKGSKTIEGDFPKKDYLFKSNLNNIATESRIDTVDIGGSVPDMDLEIPDAQPSEYTNVTVTETKSGHLIVYDDTAGAERIMIRHRLGSGIEMRQDGTVIYSSIKNTVRVTAEDEKVIVDGDGELQYNGNLKLKVAGDFDLEVGGDFNVNVEGDYEQKVKRGYIQDIAGNKELNITGDKSETIVGHNNTMILQQSITNIKGNNFLNVGGQMTQHTGDTLTMTAEHEVVLSTLNANISASSLTVMGDSGTIGGNNIVYYGHTAHIPRVNATSVHASQGVIATVGMTAPTFNGNLSGNASTAGKSNIANSLGSGAGDSQGTVTIDSAADSNTVPPTTSIINNALNFSPKGIRRISIDEENFIKNKIDKSENYGGVSKTDLTTKEVRSKLRDPNNINNETFVGAILAEGLVSPAFTTIGPQETGRISGKKADIDIDDGEIYT